jgi:hypothetical protein
LLSLTNDEEQSSCLVPNSACGLVVVLRDKLESEVLSGELMRDKRVSDVLWGELFG